jgi:cation transport ATPase
MDESFLTGEPFIISKGPGTKVLSGAVNGEAPLRVRATRLAADSRFAQIVRVMQDAEQRRPALRRIGDQLGAWYTPAAITVAGLAWYASGDPLRFLSVVVIATPCPLLIAIPVAIIGAISTAAAGASSCAIPRPSSSSRVPHDDPRQDRHPHRRTTGRERRSLRAAVRARKRCLPMVAAMEQYSRHPLAAANRARRRSPPGIHCRTSSGSVKSQASALRAKIGSTRRADHQPRPSSATGRRCRRRPRPAWNAS